MKSFPQELLQSVADHLFTVEDSPRQRWTQASDPVKDILNFRLVCRRWYAATWTPFRAAVQNSTFALDEESLWELGCIARHPEFKRRPHTLRFSVDMLKFDPSTVCLVFGGHVRYNMYNGLFDRWYDREWTFQNSSEPKQKLGDVFRQFGNIRIELAPRGPKTWLNRLKNRTVYAWLADALELLCLPRQPKTSKIHQMWNPDIDFRISLILCAIATSGVNLESLTVSESLQHMDDMPLARMDSVLFHSFGASGTRLALKQLKSLHFQFIDDELSDNLVYKNPANHDKCKTFISTLSSASQLKSLDLFVCNGNWDEAESPILSKLCNTTPKYQLEELVLTMAYISASDLLSLFRMHQKTVKTVILIGPRLQSGTWNSLFMAIAALDIQLDYFELYKPYQGHKMYVGNEFPIYTRLLGKAARSTYVVPYEADLNPKTGMSIVTGRQELWEHNSALGRPLPRKTRFLGC